jgi:anti-sigma factor RsiW
MDCKKAEWLLLQSLDERLGPEEADLLKGHLEGCPSCRRKAEEYRTIVRLVRPQTVPEPLPYFKERFMAGLRKRRNRRPLLPG